MTSFQLHGASVTILNLSGMSNDLIEYLDAPTDAPAWTACDVWKDPSSSSRLSATERPEVVVYDGNEKMAASNLPPLTFDDFQSTGKTMILRAAKKLAENEALLTKYDTIVGDGDCGITMKRGATAVEEGINNGKISSEHPIVTFSNIADTISDSMGGTSGVLLELMFRKMSLTLSNCDSIGPVEIAKAFDAGVERVQVYGGATRGSRTMLDALIPAAEALLETNSLSEASSKAKWGADGTAKMKTAGEKFIAFLLIHCFSLT
jgi:dihydroxyacetone kinase